MDEAKELTRLAKENGGDLVKAQLFDSMKLYGKHTPSELSFDQAKMLFDYGNEVGIEVFFSVFDVERVKWCEEIGVKRYKVACASHEEIRWNIDSQELVLPDFIRAVQNTGKEVIVSSPGGGVFRISDNQKSLFCVSHYPTHIDEIHFDDGMFEDENGGEYEKSYDGFSDHTIGLDVAKIALARGAQIIEKHFCINHKTGIDAKWSMNIHELKELKRWANVCEGIL